MLGYRTEVVIPEDRYLCLRVPDALPVGRAILMVRVQVDDGPGLLQAPDQPSDDPDRFDADREDIEWWDEFAEDVAPVE